MQLTSHLARLIFSIMKRLLLYYQLC